MIDYRPFRDGIICGALLMIAIALVNIAFG